MKAILFSLLMGLHIHAIELKTGDILLQPLSCWTCSLIEAQENTQYSHIGVYLNINGNDFVIEAFGKVHIITLSQFLAKTEKDKNVEVIRFNNINFKEDKIIKKARSFEGLAYDSEFLWDNIDEQNQEMLYCSELVYKLFENNYTELPLKRMRFDINREYWIRYFRGNPPDGEWGNSPGDFERSHLFHTTGIL